MRMPRLIAGLVTAGLLGVTPLALSAPANATDNLTTTATLEVSAPVVAYGDDISITGRVTASDGLSPVYGVASLQVYTSTSPVWTTVATDDSPGYISLFDVVPATNSSYRVVYSGYTAQNQFQDTYGPSESAPVAVGVARKIKAKTPGLRVVGKVTPDYKKSKVKVFRKVGKKYKAFKTVKTNKKSKFSVKLPAAKRGKKLFFRLYIAGDANYVATVDDYYTYSF